MKTYTTPVVRDYGDLYEKTAAGSIGNHEDGGNKSISLHLEPIARVSAYVLKP